MSAGNGPRCPVDPAHGRLYDNRNPGPRTAWFCPHSAHGGNGKFFSDKEAHGEYELRESDVTILYESAARDVIAGKITLDQAVTNVAKQSKMATSQVREAIAIMIDTIREKDTDMADKKAAAKTAKKTAPKAAAQRQRVDHTEAAEFLRVRDELGLTAKQSALATGEAGMGSSSTYVYILTHQGASTELFNKYEAALRSYAKKHSKEIAAERKEADARAAAKAAPKVAKAAPAKAAAKATPAKAPAKAATPAKAAPAAAKAPAAKASAKAPVKVVAAKAATKPKATAAAAQA